mgnify:CR=1 FL=1
MVIGSLFSGIGGLELGLESAIPGAYTAWQVEQAEYPRRVLAKHWPNARRYEDVRMVHRPWMLPNGDQRITQPLEPVDLICGGFPCQDISVAGSGAGLSGKRSGLWFEYLRIVRALRPRFVVIENVGALRRRGLDTVLWGLAESGYDAEWSVLSAADVGAPHLRKRLFIIAWLPNTDVQRREEQRLSEPRRKQGTRRGLVDGRSKDGQQRNATGVIDGCVEPGMGGATHGLSAWAYRGTDPEAWERGVARTVEARSVPDRSARLRALGNAVLPQCGHEIGRRVVSIARSVYVNDEGPTAKAKTRRGQDNQP